MDDWLAPLGLVESVENYVEIFRQNNLISPEDLYLSDFKLDDFYNMGITNENDRTAIYYAINPEELDSLANSITPVDEYDIDAQIREAEMLLVNMNNPETEQDPAELSLENQIKQAEQRMKELQNEMKSDAHVSETSDDLEEKALNEKIKIEEEALKALEIELRKKEQMEKEQRENQAILAERERERKEKLAIQEREREKAMQIEAQREREREEAAQREKERLVIEERDRAFAMQRAATHSPERNKLGTSSPERKVSKPKAKSRPQSPDRVIDNNNFLDTVPFKDGRLASDYTYKVIIIGDSGVGKSNIINRWMGGLFSHEIPPTIQCAYFSKSFHVSDHYVDVQLWDTAGQERYVSLTRSFYRGAHGVVLVYDICNRTSFQSLTRWIDTVSIELEIADTHFIVIGNKSDHSDHREVSVEEGLNFSKSKKMFFLETSALDGSNCNKALQILLQEIHNKYAVRLTSSPQATNVTNLKTVQLKEHKKDDGCVC